ncbi:YaaA family protein [Raoultibacter phocaeensis]|uniref:YaaA family protein n=1 Tax=Raoultibacter phocaeensis TaxID=2479841 RepID=UPI00111BA224|nr:YaaA family protein [Raoultibacter phocaeensis]
MKILVSPAKKMNNADDVFAWRDLPRFVDRAEELMRAVKTLTYDEAKELWRTSDALTELNFERFRTMDVRGLEGGLSPAVFSYEGIQYQHMAPAVMEQSQLEYLQEHLRILSGFYGMLRPFDGVVPYRLEMQANLSVGGARDLYAYWGDDLANAVAEDEGEILNLASVEYAKAVLPHLNARERGQGKTQARQPSCGLGGGLHVVTCLFGRIEQGRLKQRATAAKAARGSMVRWCAERRIERAGDVRAFDVANYRYREDLSEEHTYVFEEPRV